jgi:hypothetical protein
MDKCPSQSRIRFESLYKDIELIATDEENTVLTRCEDGSYLLEMKSNTGALVIAR